MGKEIVQLNEVADESGISTVRFDGDPFQTATYDDIIGQDDLQQPVSGQSIVADTAGHVTGKLSNAHKQIGALRKALAASKISLQAALKRADTAERVAASVERERDMLEIQLQSVREKGHEENEERVDENNILENPNQDDDNINGDFDQAASSLPKERNHHLRVNNRFEGKKKNQLKQAAAVTIRTLKRLLNEKNEEFYSLRSKLDAKRVEVSIEEETERSAMG